MFCTQCGKEVPNDARFCGFCGHAMVPPKPVCPACGCELTEQTAFCTHCGARTNVQPASPPPQDPSQAWEQPPQWQQHTQEQEEFLRWQQTYAQRTNWSGEKLKSIENVSWLSGNKSEKKIVFTNKASGSLYIYRDRVELELAYGSSNWIYALGLVGMAISRSRAKKAPPVIFPMDQIASVQGSTDKSTFKARSIVLQMKSGEAHTFAGSFTEQDIQECLQIIQANIR